MGTLPDGRELTDLEMMKSSEEWPRMVLPLKQAPWRVAVLATSDGRFFYLFEDKSMFERLDVNDDTIGPLAKDELQQVIDRGWRVD